MRREITKTEANRNMSPPAFQKHCNLPKTHTYTQKKEKEVNTMTVLERKERRKNSSRANRETEQLMDQHPQGRPGWNLCGEGTAHSAEKLRDASSGYTKEKGESHRNVQRGLTP